MGELTLWFKNKLSTVLPSLPVIAGVLIGWEFIVGAFDLPVWLVPKPTQVWNEFMGMSGWFLHHTWITVRKTLVGFAASLGGGVGLALLIAWNDRIRNMLYPIILFFQVVPKIALAPIIIIWFGFGFKSHLIIIFLIAFFPVLVDTTTGMLEVDETTIYMAKSFAASKTQIFRKIRFPHSMPYFFSAAKVCATLCLIGAVVAEFIAANEGLGYVIVHGQQFINTPQQFAAFFLLAMFGLALFASVGVAERILTPWRAKVE